MDNVKRVQAYNLDEDLVIWIERKAGAETAAGSRTSASALVNEMLGIMKQLDERQGGGFRVLIKKLLNGKKSITSLKSEL